MEKVRGRLGFGCMRLPMNGEEVDYIEFSKMIDFFLDNGFNYFDTAHMYVGGKSETALRDCLVKRHDRESYILTNKLSAPYFKTNEEIIPFFESQLKLCGVEYFDFYLMHSQDKEIFEKFKKCRAYETASELKKQGKIKHLGISFHDTADVLDEILSEYPEIEVVQIQFNYSDFEDKNVQSKLCYEVCKKHNKPIIVMEPVRGGSLAHSLPDEALKVFSDLNGGSPASYALRFVADFPEIFMILSGMGNMDMISENVGLFKDLKPLEATELDAISKVCDIIKKQPTIPCTACCYCVEGCPKNILIPDLFGCLSERMRWKNKDVSWSYNFAIKDHGKASECIECGKCEKACPQHLPIRELLKTVAKTFE